MSLNKRWWATPVVTYLFGLFMLSFLVNAASIDVSLQTSFSAASYLVELIETAASENSSAYFPLLDHVAAGDFADLRTDKELYEKFLTILQNEGHISKPDSLSSFKLALSLHAMAPRIEAHFQYYNTSVASTMMGAQDAVCPVWVHFDGQQYCSPALERAQQPVAMKESELDLPFDRTFGPKSEVPVSILYADITHPLFAQFHETVSQTARQGKTSYKVRYRPSTGVDARPLVVGGYGVELVMKRTDYIVIDDRTGQKAPVTEQMSLEQLQEEEMNDIKPLASSELVSLGLNAAHFIASSPDPMDALLKITSDFPKYSALLASKPHSEEFFDEWMGNRAHFLPAGFNTIWINGLQIEPRQVNAYSLLEHLKIERAVMQQLRDVGLTPTEGIKLLSHEAVATAQIEDNIQRFDWRDEIEGEKVIMWLNDLEKDKRYSAWPQPIMAVFQRTYPGQLPNVAKDIHNLVVPIKMDSVEDMELVAMTLQNMVTRLVPIRVGLVPYGDSSEAVENAKMVYHLLDTYGLSPLLRFFETLAATKSISNAPKAFASITKDRAPRQRRVSMTVEEVLTSEQYAERIIAGTQYLQRLELQGGIKQALLNGVILPRGDDWFEKLSNRVWVDHQFIQQAVYYDTLTDDMWAPNFFLNTAHKRRNSLIFPQDAKSIVLLDMTQVVENHKDALNSLPRLKGDQNALPGDRAHLLLLADLDSQTGQELLLEAIKFHESIPEVEIAILHNGVSYVPSAGVSQRLYEEIKRGDRDVSHSTLRTVLDTTANPAEEADQLAHEALAFWNSKNEFARSLGLSEREGGLWLNGRVLGPISQPFAADDFELLYRSEQKQRISPIAKAITELELENRFQDNLHLAKIISLVARSAKSDLPEGLRESSPLIRLDRFKAWNGTHTCINLSKSEDASFQIVAAIDPASEQAQPWVQILKVLSELDGVDMKIYLNPVEKLSELPVKRFYRDVMSSAPSFDVDGALINPRAVFSGIPKDVLFTLGMIISPSWLVAPKDSIYDLDNIKLNTVPAGQDVTAIYELEHILIEGHSREMGSNAAPRGVQLLLGTEDKPHFTDTLVMANLGYFQFKANPGYWQISLKPGRSSKIFNIDSVGSNGYSPQSGDETTNVALLSFQGVTLYPRLSRRPGMEQEDVLEGDVAPKAMSYLSKGAAFASSALSSLGLKKPTKGHADINIFSVASGHLYERMLNIMMLSVMKHTSHSVKFWFIEQFLSPSFKSTLPDLAAHYGFEYEMVTYKWPHWLRSQKEKQREIWGYKILFLDVLFPLSLDKVIFVDADQIVRTDMMNLNKVDLQGAPYGFTPMCDSRTEMEGYRFWKQGYWESYLKGKPYHISALYVIDLKKFREAAAGDRLRQQYQALSADPNSLSNLDQDLPNHMQHTLPIHSLSQEWLWCETWCSDESLRDAKTIDLCNNPMTKEPKLDRARRQVPEWTLYDDEIAGVILKATGRGNQTMGEGSIPVPRPPVVAVQESEDRRRKEEL